MEDVNIYIATSSRGCKVKNGIGIYLLECFYEGKPYTVHEIVHFENAGNNEMTLKLLIMALKRMQKSSVVRVFTKCEHVFYTLNNAWIAQWEKNGWRNAKGNTVKHEELWREAAELLVKHAYTVTDERHSYETWMNVELRKMKEGRV